MPDAHDMDLIREFACTNSEIAFTELVQRHVNLVYSIARRCTGNDSDAQDVTQAVFIILAKKANHLAQHTVLPGWLYETTRFTATRLLRTQARRAAREQEAYMQSTLNETDLTNAWQQLAPHLEAAMDKISAADRALLVLRFYENKTAAETAVLLGIGEDAAQKRVTRAIEKLRKLFVKRGVTLTSTAIAGAVSANSVHAAPVTLTKTISAAALTKGATATTSTLTLVKGALKLMAWSKVKTTVLVTVAILVAGSSVGVGLHIEKRENAKAALKLFQQVQEKYASLDSFSYEGTGVFMTSSKTNQSIFSVRLGRPCSYRHEIHTSGSSPSENLGWSSGDYIMSHISWLTNTLYKIKSTPEERLKRYDGLDLDSVMPTCLPTEFFFASDNQNPFKILTRTNTEVSIYLAGADNVANHDCQRLVIGLPLQSKRLTLWVGKDDFLIYQTELYFEKVEASVIDKKLVYSPASQMEKYTNIQTNPEFQPKDFIPDEIPTGLTIKESFP